MRSPRSTTLHNPPSHCWILTCASTFIILSSLLLSCGGGNKNIRVQVDVSRTEFLTARFSVISLPPRARQLGWDFDGDGRFEQISDATEITHQFPYAGKFNVRVSPIPGVGKATFPVMIPQQLSTSPWPKYKRDSANRSLSPYAGPKGPRVTATPVYLTPGFIQTSPSLGEGTIYMGSDQGEIYSFGPEGQHDWTFPLTSNYRSIKTAPLVGRDGTIYFGSLDNYLYAVLNGKLLWRFKTGGDIWSCPSLSPEGNIYFGSKDGTFYALRSDGSLLWSYRTGAQILDSPALDSIGNVYIGSSDGNLYSFDNTGKLRWKLDAKGDIIASPVVTHDDNVVVGTARGMLYYVSSSGKGLWEFKLGGSVGGAPSIGNSGTIYVGTLEGAFFAILPDGKSLFRLQMPGPIWSSPTIDRDERIYIPAYDGYLYAMDRNGGLLFRIKLGEKIWSTPVIAADGLIYCASLEKTLYRIEDEATAKTETESRNDTEKERVRP